MKIGTNIRNWGPTSSRDMIAACAAIADASQLDSIWVNDRIAVPPGGAATQSMQFDSGRCLDLLATLTWIAGQTQRIKLGTGVLLLPYRPALPLFKWVATLQELSAGRLIFGVGIGWMEEEFQALGIPRKKRAAISEQALEFFNRAFTSDVIEANDQQFFFQPRPERPPLLIGGNATVAIPRAVRHNAGWIPAGVEPDGVAAGVTELRLQAEQAGLSTPPVVAMKTLPLDDIDAAITYAKAFQDAGADQLVHTQKYDTTDDYRRIVDLLEQHIIPAVA